MNIKISQKSKNLEKLRLIQERYLEEVINNNIRLSDFIDLLKCKNIKQTKNLLKNGTTNKRY